MLSSRNWIVQFYLKILTSGKQNCFSFCGTSSFRPLTGAPPPEVPAHKALCTCISLSLGRLPDPSWKRRPGRPRGRWIDQFRRDNSQPPADLWRQAINRGHSGRATQRSSDYAATWPDLTPGPRCIATSSPQIPYIVQFYKIFQKAPNKSKSTKFSWENLHTWWAVRCRCNAAGWCCYAGKSRNCATSSLCRRPGLISDRCPSRPPLRLTRCRYWAADITKHKTIDKEFLLVQLKTFISVTEGEDYQNKPNFSYCKER